jgi:hypothetical protein
LTGKFRPFTISSALVFYNIPQISWCHSKFFLKQAGKMRGAIESHRKGDICDGVIFIFVANKLLVAFIQSLFANPFGDRSTAALEQVMQIPQRYSVGFGNIGRG